MQRHIDLTRIQQCIASFYPEDQAQHLQFHIADGNFHVYGEGTARQLSRPDVTSVQRTHLADMIFRVGRDNVLMFYKQRYAERDIGPHFTHWGYEMKIVPVTMVT